MKSNVHSLTYCILLDILPKQAKLLKTLTRAFGV